MESTSFSRVRVISRTDPRVDGLIKKYWFRYKKIEVILAYLRTVHRVAVGLTWLKKRLNYLGLHRRGDKIQYTAISEVQKAIEIELQGCNSRVGYRQMWMVLREKYLMTVKRLYLAYTHKDKSLKSFLTGFSGLITKITHKCTGMYWSTVQMLLSVMDPEGVRRRQQNRLVRRVYQNKGPDFVWHLDGYDKLKPYGFAIHGCIDGFSRKIIWLEVLTTNNNPNVVLVSYLLAVLENNGCPSIVRADHGTENTTLAAAHMALRHQHHDDLSGSKSFRFGSSTTNTRIESWWSQLRKSVTDWWINVFKDLIQEGNFNPNNTTHKHILAYVYGLLLKRSLDDFKARWNSHRIRPNKVAGCPDGVPEDLYNLPQLNGTRSYKQSLDFEVWAYCFLEYAQNALPFYPEEFRIAAESILNELHITRLDITFDVAKPLYLHLCNIMS